MPSVQADRVLPSLADDTLPSVPADPVLAPFPTHVLPPPLRAWVEATAEATQTDPAAAALLALAVGSAALAGRVQIAAAHAAPQPLSLLVGLLLDEADHGDALMASAMRPLRTLEFAELAEAAEQAASDAFYREQAHGQLAELKAAYRIRPDEKYLEQILAAQADLASARRPTAPRRIVADCTPRGLERQLGEQGRAACFAPRGELFRRLAGRGGTARDRLAELLAAGQAGESFAADIGGGRVVAVRQAQVTCAVQFDASLAAAFAAQRQPPRSLFARFLFAAPHSRAGARSVAPPPVPGEIAEKYRAGIERMAKRGAGWWSLSPAAETQLAEFRGELERALAAGGRLASVRHWATHLGDATLRIAGLLHAWGDSLMTPLTEDAVAAAIAIARWLAPQAGRVLRALGLADDDCSPEERTALRLARAAREFSSREAMQHLRKTFLHRNALERALAGLVRKGYLRGLPAEGEANGRPPTARFGLVEQAVELDARPAAPSEAAACGELPPVPPRERAAGTQKSLEEYLRDLLATRRDLAPGG